MPGAPPSLSHARSSGLAARRKGDPLGGFAPHPHPPTPRPRVRPAPATFRVASGAAPLPACLLDVHPEVAAALAAGEAVVALESTIISHGMPHPANVETAARVEAAVRAAGAVPATIAVLGGTATLARSRIAVVCAGPKTLLDIPRTLEVLETAGVGVAALGTDEFPAFFTPRSGCAAPLRVEDAAGFARMVLAQERLGLTSGLILGVPIPEHLAAEGQEIEAATATALAEAEAQGIQGAEITPFMLDRIQVLTQGRSLAANIQLILNNARVGAEVAVELSRLRRGGQGQATEG
ncbi:Pseudouridine-5'-phosphate glycosidase [Auxenochlorella protothecoides]|uniref:Pseudouridine-5'-phosphate glycosidase n=1 Tax=Auxenochlorella protothecoides TaxID=3075 RepID=A0A087SGK2_AUXPR|nr:Pseudouridine-5'-phosphate glycosidase [Auxenochlorella protothecoides]KFM24856.1 Pseudouridine-5'-phosphate glycosidase [Auxenochlorella protothecoides]